MASSFKRVGALALAIGSLLSAGLAHAAGSYYNLGGGMIASGSSADGSVISAYVSGGSFYSWTAATGVVSIGGSWQGGTADVSDDGRYISGSAIGSDGLTQAARYDRTTGTWTPLGGIGGSSDGSATSGWGISGNGNVVVGLGWINAGSAHAVQSTGGGAMVDLGGIGGSSRANGTNADGTVIAGWVEQDTGFWQGAFWRNGVLTPMVDGNGEALPQANAVSADGTWIIGNGGFDLEPWRYNTVTGAVQYLGDFNPSGTNQAATGISADGRIIVGYDRPFGPATFGQGTIWIEGLGMQSLTTYVTSQGVDLQGRTLALPLGVSADGNTFYGLDNGGRGFVVTLAPVPEPQSFALLALGLAGVVASVRRRRGETAAQ